MEAGTTNHIWTWRSYYAMKPIKMSPKRKIEKKAEEVKSGEWYFEVICHNCKKPILPFHAPSKSKITFEFPEKFRVTCPNPKCRLQSDYNTGEVQRFRAKQMH
jgi:hypothetical protein